LVLRRTARALLDLVYPQECIACGAGLPRPPASFLCDDCRDRLPLIGPWQCARCGDETGPFAEGASACRSCAERPALPFRGAVAACRFEGPAREMVHRLKYSGDTRAVGWMAREMALRLSRAAWAAEVEWIVPVPLHWSRHLSRRFNQSQLLADALGESSGKPCLPRLLRRTRRTPAQVTLDFAARERNVAGAFAARHPDRLKEKTILLVDDVMTTCATARECARPPRSGREARLCGGLRAVGDEGRRPDADGISARNGRSFPG